jgi:NADP-dependent aldehyde dehydrogenase
MATVAGVDPRTATPLPPVAESTTADGVIRIARHAADASTPLEGLGREGRAALLEAMAAAIERHREELVATASSETGFGTAKLDTELTRAAFQFRFFSDVLRDGGYLEATIDHAGDTPMGPRPDLRRILVPIGPVAVFGASNFPFAFSVLGGDTASALAAGCPVVVKAHESHPATSKVSFEILDEAAQRFSAPDHTVGIIYGVPAGAGLVAHPDIRAVGFTGSLAGGKALIDIVNRRAEPIPFYGELSSINPVVITPAAAAAHGQDIAAGLVGSFTLGAGQLCTKPGLVLVPDTGDGDRVVAAVRDAVRDISSQTLLNERVYETYRRATQDLRAPGGITSVASSPSEATEGYTVDALVFETDIEHLAGGLITEIFGPVTVLVRYDATDPVHATAVALDAVPRSLTTTIHHNPQSGVDTDLTARLTDLVTRRAGRVIYNGFPTGVAVAGAQTHGGPWPSTNSLHTSVGATAIRRFLRPLTFQDAAAAVLPAELRDGDVGIPRRIDGVAQVPESR